LAGPSASKAKFEVGAHAAAGASRVSSLGCLAIMLLASARLSLI
jgi:hypothetical protein